MRVLEWTLVAVVLLAGLPLVAGCYQSALAAFYGFRRDARRGDADHLPRVAIVVPAWNEAAVIGRTIDTLVSLDYPAGHLRIYVVDDASTDDTPDVVRAAAERHPGQVFHLRREQGGEGKAHTINHGLRTISSEDWYDAVLIIDADVLFTERSLWRMARHLADPGIGAVTGYIKEGSRPANFMNRFVAYEYVNAQAGARRAQNVLGAQACLAGGAQLLRRDALEALGGEIDTSTLAEDTVTTLGVQLSGLRVVFEPHAIVWAEEPRDIRGLWKQRLRWGRGNLQITSYFSRMWLRGGAGALGGPSFALIWFSVTLMPVFMVTSSIALVLLFVLDREVSLSAFSGLWVINLFTYLFVTFSSFSLDPSTARSAWREGLAFPGLVSLAIIVYTCYPPLVEDHLAGLLRDAGIEPDGALRDAALVFTYAWLSTSMLAAYAVKRIESISFLGRGAPALLYVVGYGPLLCAITAAAYLAEIKGSAMVWEKTEKTGAIGEVK